MTDFKDLVRSDALNGQRAREPSRFTGTTQLPHGHKRLASRIERDGNLGRQSLSY